MAKRTGLRRDESGRSGTGSGSGAPGTRRRAAGALFGPEGLVGALGNWRERGFHLVRTARGWAAVFEVEGPDGDPVRVLDVGGAYQSATYLGKRRFEPVFSYYRAFDAVFAAGISVRRVLMLGAGGCAWPKHAAASHAGLTVDAVEEDPRIAEAARRFFFAGELERPCAGRGVLNLVAAEGRAFLEGGAEPYDAILNDAFCGEEPALRLATVEAAQAVARRLAPGGLYLANVVSRDGGADLSFLRAVVATLSRVFPTVQVIPCPDQDFSDEDNFLVAATAGPARLPGALPYDAGFPTAPLRDR